MRSRSTANEARVGEGSSGRSRRAATERVACSLSVEHYADLRQDARAILLEYVVAMGLSLFPLIPQSLVALGQEILIVFVFILATSARSAPQLFRSSGIYGRRNRWFRAALFVTG